MSLDNLDQKLQAEQPTLSATEQADLWQRISPQVSAPASVVSPYTIYLSFIHSRTMTSLIIALIFILGAGGTVAVSEAAKPGDLLFPIERAAEKTRLAFAGEERAAELRADYATQRFEELLKIIEEEGIVTAYSNATSTTASSTEAIVTFRAEADVFTDITIVKVEANDQKRIFTTATTTRAGVVSEIASRYDLASSTIEASLDFEIEDRASRPGERGVVLVDNTGEERISKAVNVLLDLLDDVDSEDARNGLLTALLTQIDNVSVRGRDDSDGRGNDNQIEQESVDSRIKIEDDRVEIREDGYRIKIDKDGKVEVKGDDDNGDSRNEDRDDDKYYPTSNPSVGTSTKIRLEVEADVYTDITEVKVELNDVKTTFVTLAKTREAVAQEVAVLYQVEKSLVLQVLDLEIENGSSIGNDSQSNDDVDDDTKDDDENEDEDRYEDDDDDRDDDRRGGGDDEDDEDDEDEDSHEGREDDEEDDN